MACLILNLQEVIDNDLSFLIFKSSVSFVKIAQAFGEISYLINLLIYKAQLFDES